MISWPSFLPVPTIEGYKLKIKPRLSSTDMDSGPRRVRRRYTRSPTIASMRWQFSEREFGLFEWWFENRLNAGASWFSGPAANGTGLIDVQCRFIESDSGPYDSNPISSNIWIVTAEVEIDQMPKGNLLQFWPDGVNSLSLDFVNQVYEVPM